MEQYKKILNKKLTLMTAFTGFSATFIILIGAFVYITANINKDIPEVITGFQIGIFIGFQIIMLLYITKYKKALNTKDDLKKLYIEEHDERTKLINDKISGVGFLFSIVLVATVTIIAGFFNQIVFVTLVAVLIFMLLVIAFLKAYYKNKF